MSRVINKGVVMRCKAVTVDLLTVVGLLVEPIATISKPRIYLEEFISIRQHPITVTSSSMVITPSLSRSFFLQYS